MLRTMGPDESRAGSTAASATTSGWSRAIAWLCVLLWIGLIVQLGGQGFSSAQTSRFLGPLLHWLFPTAAPETLEQAQFAIRKTAHAFEYGVLALLSFRAWRLSYGWKPSRTALASLAIVIAVASFDETRQSQLADRMGAVSDVVLDSSGGVFALLVGQLAMRWIPWLR